MSVRAFKDKETFLKTFEDYLKKCKKEDKLPNVAGFSVYADINRDTFYAQREIYTDTFNKINQILEDQALNCKCLSDARVIFYMKNKCGYKDKVEQDITHQSHINIVNDLPKE